MKLAAIGSNCIDMYTNIENGKAYPGGGPVNMAVYSVRLGESASYIGPVGTDNYGKIMKDAISAKGVDVSHLHIKPGNTAITYVELINGERVFGDYHEGVLESYSLTDEDIEFILKHDIVVCDLWGKVEHYFSQLKQRGIITAFDCATRPEDDACKIAIPHTDYLFFSSDSDRDESLKEQMIGFHKKGAKVVIAMLGEKGSLCYDGKNFHSFGIVPCEQVVDTMGAGDSYIAGFLKGVMNNESLEKAMEMGATAATETLQYFGAW